MLNSLKLYKKIVINPEKGFKNIIKSKRPLVHGRNALVFLAILFILPNAVMVFIKAESPIPPVVTIPIEYFYHWIIVIGIPAQIPLFIMTSGIIYLLCNSRCELDFKVVFALTTYSLSLPFFIYALFEIVLAIYLLISGGKSVPLTFIYYMFISMGVTVIGHIYYLTKMIKTISKNRVIRSLLYATISTVIFWIFAALFFA